MKGIEKDIYEKPVLGKRFSCQKVSPLLFSLFLPDIKNGEGMRESAKIQWIASLISNSNRQC